MLCTRDNSPRRPNVAATLCRIGSSIHDTSISLVALLDYLKLEGEAYSALCDSRPVTLGAMLSVCDLSLIRALITALGATSQAPPTIALSQFPLLTVYDTIMDLVSAPPAVEALLLFVEVQRLDPDLLQLAGLRIRHEEAC